MLGTPNHFCEQNVFKPVGIRRFHEVSDRLSRAILVADGCRSQIDPRMQLWRRTWVSQGLLSCNVSNASCLCTEGMGILLCQSDVQRLVPNLKLAVEIKQTKEN